MGNRLLKKITAISASSLLALNMCQAAFVSYAVNDITPQQAPTLLSDAPTNQDSDSRFLSGKCGNDLTWSLDTESGELTISGTGKMWDYTHENGFSKLTQIKSIDIERGVSSISCWAFRNCENLTSVVIRDGLESIGEAAFSGCKNLTDIIIPGSVKSIGCNTYYENTSAFEGTPWLEKQREENPLVIVNNFLIDGRSCKGDVIVPDSVEYIAANAFLGNKDLTSIQLNNYLLMIEQCAFGNCENLTSVKIPKKVTSIERMTFIGCSNLTYVDIPAGIEYIDSMSFYGSGLTDVYFHGSEEQWKYLITYTSDNQPLLDANISFADQTETTIKVEIVDNDGDTLLLKPADEPESERRLTLSKEYLGIDVLPTIGMKLEITYTGGILQTSPEQFDDVKKVEVIYDEHGLLPGQMRVTLVDYDTGEPIIFDEDTFVSISTNVGYHTSEGTMYTGPVFGMEKNHVVVDNNFANFFDADIFSFGLDSFTLPKGYSFPDNAKREGYYNGTIEPENSVIVTRYDSGSADVVFRLKFTPTGDVNGDGKFNVADAVAFQKWLLAVPNAELANWKAADLCEDDVLNCFDMTMMRRLLIQ